LYCITFREFLKSLALFNKPLVAGVHGAAVGLGVKMLPFFDMVFASDKATFYTPYAKLGQVPEGAAILTLPHMLGNAVVSTFALADCNVHYLCPTILYILFALPLHSCTVELASHVPFIYSVQAHPLAKSATLFFTVTNFQADKSDHNVMYVHCAAHCLRLIAEFV
jgi:hypothetical protein